MIPMMELVPHHADLIVVGGGLAGLSAAALVARAGRSVVVLERADRLGGRAATRVRRGVHFNLGPHALYRRGHAARLLEELRVPFRGRVPDADGALLLAGDALHPIPFGPASLFTSSLLATREKWRLVRLLMTLKRLDTRALDRIPLRDWIERAAGTGNLASLLRTFLRVSTYADDPGRLSAGAALDQLRLALAGNVWYLDGGWQTVVDGLRDVAVGHGAEVRAGARAESVKGDGEGVSVRLADGAVVRGRVAVLAVDPKAACNLLGLPGDAPLVRRSADIVPVRAACLDLALDRLPRPDRRVAFGLDRPLYYSVHSASARLAPEGIAVLHVMKYLGSGEDPASPPRGVERELEGFLDRLQPGWQGHTVVRRFLPGMTVAHALPLAAEGGLAGRPGVTLRERPGVFLAGDWVGDAGMLADASAASAREAAGRVLDALEQVPIRPHRSLSHAGA